jgi:hypothetical protein
MQAFGVRLFSSIRDHNKGSFSPHADKVKAFGNGRFAPIFDVREPNRGA